MTVKIRCVHTYTKYPIPQRFPLNKSCKISLIYNIYILSDDRRNRATVDTKARHYKFLLQQSTFLSVKKSTKSS